MKPSWPESNGNEGVLHISQIFKAGASPSDYLMSYPDSRWSQSYSSAEMQG